MIVLCRSCKYFNKRNLCSAHTKKENGLLAYMNKVYIELVVANTKECEWFKCKNKVTLIIQEVRLYFNQYRNK